LRSIQNPPTPEIPMCREMVNKMTRRGRVGANAAPARGRSKVRLVR
jgi:hypothetical protein